MRHQGAERRSLKLSLCLLVDFLGHLRPLCSERASANIWASIWQLAMLVSLQHMISVL
jgi:hypothetical protein